VLRRLALAGAILAACQAAPPPVPAAASARPKTPPAPFGEPAALATASHPKASLPYVELMTGGARPDEPAPLVIALHGLGDRPETFLSLFTGFHAAARVVAPHAEAPYGTGYAWFDRAGLLTDLRAPDIAKMATTVAAFANERAAAAPTFGKPIIMGFSQGGALSLEIGVHHANAIAAAFPVGGWLAPALWPRARPQSAVSITLFHGTADPIVPFDATKAAVTHLQSLGFPVVLHEYAGVEHGISGKERSELLDAIAAECEKQRRAGKSVAGPTLNPTR
jgi:phospholipase/carboxylesterase